MATSLNIDAASASPAESADPQNTVRLYWPASADYQFVFQLFYSSNGNFVTIQCELRSKKVDFPGNPYSMPLSLQMQDSSKQDVSIQMRLAPGHAPYAGAVWCKINVPGFMFEGTAFEFSAISSGPAPFTIW